MSESRVFTRSKQVAANGVDTFVAEAGDGAPIVLLHGNPDTHDVWEPVVEQLAPKYRCIAPDLPGFGKSRAPKDFDVSLANQGAWVKGLVDALGLDRFHLVVHDVGGPYGLSFTTDNATRLRTLTTFNTSFSSKYRWHFWARVWRTRVLGELAMGIANRPLFIRELRRGSPRIPREYASHAYDAFGRDAKKMVLRWYRAMNPSVYDGWEERLRAAIAHVPRQVLWGDLDPFIPKQFADDFGVEPRHFPDCGHWVMQEDPVTAATAIGNLVAQHA